MGQSYQKRKVLAAIMAMVLIIIMVPTLPVMGAESQVKDGSSTNPAKTVLTGATLDGTKVILTWKKNSTADGYQIYVSKAKSGKFTELAKVNKSKTTYTITKVQDGTWYYKIRAYKTVDKNNYYGAFSSVKSVTLKRTVTKGEIKIPKATDSTLAAPTDVYVGEVEKETWEGANRITIKESVPGLFWTNSNETADVFYIQYYDENDNLIDAGMNFSAKEETLYHTTLFKSLRQEDYTIKTIVITPVNSIDGAVNTDPASGKDKIGDSTVFNCEIKVNVKNGKKVAIAVENVDGTNEQIRMTLSEKTTPYGSYFTSINYKDEKGNIKYSGHGSNAESTGEIILYESEKNYKSKYKNASIITIELSSGIEMKGADKASYTITIHEAEIKKQQ